MIDNKCGRLKLEAGLGLGDDSDEIVLDAFGNISVLGKFE